jgi:hypothetical protein
MLGVTHRGDQGVKTTFNRRDSSLDAFVSTLRSDALGIENTDSIRRSHSRDLSA